MQIHPSSPSSSSSSSSRSSSSSSSPSATSRPTSEVRDVTLAHRRVQLTLGVWLVVATTLAVAGALPHVPPRALPLIIWLPVLAAIAAYRTSPLFRAGVSTLAVRPIVLLHGSRAPIGAAFLVLTTQGNLPPAFGQPAGWGDLAVGLLALAVAATARADAPRGRRVLLAWNVVGFADILMAFVSAQRLVLFVHDPRMAGTLTRLPFSLIPLVVLPFVLASHLWLFARLRPRAAASDRRVITAP